MKYCKIICICAVIIALICCALPFAACNKQHTHNWVVKSDAAEHWEECVDDGELSELGKESHYDQNNDGLCDYCARKMVNGEHQHSFGSWQSNEAMHWQQCSCGEQTQQGSHIDANSDGKCDVCDRQLKSEHQHSFGSWQSNYSRHWKECVCGERTEEGSHGDDNGDNVCDVCGLQLSTQHEHTFTLNYDQTSHWRQCTCGAVSDVVAHTYNTAGKCTVCGYVKSSSQHTHNYVTIRDANQHWQRCTICGEITTKTDHSIAGNYLCSCGYAFDAPANGGETKNYWIIGTFTDNRTDGTGWGETHNAQWQFHRLVARDSSNRTQYVFERVFNVGDAFKIVNDAGSGYWDGEINASHVSADAKQYLSGNGTDNIAFIGQSGYYRIVLQVSGGSVSVDCQLVYAEEGGIVTPHEHSYSLFWSNDETAHWHSATCEHVELKQDMGNHTFDGIFCTVCGYKKPHVCVPSDDWARSETQHWRKCALCGEIIDGTLADHDGVPCSDCGYEMAISDGLKYELNAEQNGYNVVGYDYYAMGTSVRIPDSYNKLPVVGITNKAFMNCDKIQSVIIPDSVTLVDAYSFAYCYSLQRVTLGSGVKTIGASAFAYTGITNISLPAALQTIGSGAFEYSHLSSVTIPAQVTYIGSFAFRNSMGSSSENRPSLTSVKFENNVGWKVYPLDYDWDPTVSGTDISVTDEALNAHNMIVTHNPAVEGMDGYAQYIWVRNN